MVSGGFLLHRMYHSSQQRQNRLLHQMLIAGLFPQRRQQSYNLVRKWRYLSSYGQLVQAEKIIGGQTYMILHLHDGHADSL
jgi:hypothetical protein